MKPLAEKAAELRVQIDESLVAELELACKSGLALARFEQALSDVVEAIGHPALELDSRETAGGRTHTIYFLGSVVMRWCFDGRGVEIYCWRRGRNREPDHLRLRYCPRAQEWLVSMPGRPGSFGVFTDEQEKVLEIIRDAIDALSPSAELPGLD